MNTQSTCPVAITNMGKETGFAVQSYCGCPNSMDALGSGCEPCPSGYQIKDSLLLETDAFLVTELPEAATCADWILRYAPYVEDDTKCHRIHQEIQHRCCVARDDDISQTDGAIAGMPSSSAAPVQSITRSLSAAPFPMAILLVVAFVR